MLAIKDVSWASVDSWSYWAYEVTFTSAYELKDNGFHFLADLHTSL